jgi:hypothetical protein
VRTFALKNRAGLHEANKRLENDGAYLDDLEREYGREPEQQSWWSF